MAGSMMDLAFVRDSGFDITKIDKPVISLSR
jgi:hypothetical protein